MTDHISEHAMKEYHTILLAKKSSILKEIEHMNDGLRDANVHAPDPIDAAAATEERNSLMAQIDQKRLALKQTDHALANFDEFGYCLSCGEEINIKRIEFNPATTECIDCKTKAERNQRILGG